MTTIVVPNTDMNYADFASALGLMTAGEEAFPALMAAGSPGSDGSGSLNLTYWRCRKTEAITMLGCATQSTAAAATPSLCRMGLFTVAANGDLTLVASTANDVNMFNGTYSKVEKALTASYTKVAGTEYATGIIVVSGAALPNFCGSAAAPQVSGSTGPGRTWRRKATGLTDLPASLANASLSNSGSGPILTWAR